MKLRYVIAALLVAASFGCGYETGIAAHMSRDRESADMVQGLATFVFAGGDDGQPGAYTARQLADIEVEMCRTRALRSPGAPGLAVPQLCALRALGWTYRLESATRAARDGSGIALTQ